MDKSLAKIDLNLLKALHVLLEERSVTRAAGRLFITQSAMSKSLRRLRTLVGDPLFLPSPQGLFMYQFECLCRNRLRYDPGLAAMADDPLYDEAWKEWILTVRRQVGLVDFADMIYVRSQFNLVHRTRPGQPPPEVTFFMADLVAVASCAV